MTPVAKWMCGTQIEGLVLEAGTQYVSCGSWPQPAPTARPAPCTPSLPPARRCLTVLTCRSVRVLAPTEVPKAFATSLAPVPQPAVTRAHAHESSGGREMTRGQRHAPSAEVQMIRCRASTTCEHKHGRLDPDSWLGPLPAVARCFGYMDGAAPRLTKSKGSCEQENR